MARILGRRDGFTYREAGATSADRSTSTSKHRYQTFVGKGIVGGPYRITIFGQNAAPHTLPDDQIAELFPPYETTANLPHSNSEHDFDVPRQR